MNAGKYIFLKEHGNANIFKEGGNVENQKIQVLIAHSSEEIMHILAPAANSKQRVNVSEEMEWNYETN